MIAGFGEPTVEGKHGRTSRCSPEQGRHPVETKQRPRRTGPETLNIQAAAVEGQRAGVATVNRVLLASVDNSGRRAVPVEESDYVHAKIGHRGLAGRGGRVGGV